MTDIDRRRIWSAALASALRFTASIRAAGSTRTPKLDVHLQHLAKGSATERVIVRTKTGQRAGVAQKVRQHGHVVYNDHPGIEAFSASVSADTLRSLASDPDVESISTDADVDSLDSKKV